MDSRTRIAIMSTTMALALIALVFPGCGKDGRTGDGGEAPVDAGSDGAENTYYVSPSGSDSNPGTGAVPWATPGYGSKQLRPGDTMIIEGGRYSLSTYWDDMITPPSGEEGAWVTIKGEEGDRPVLAGSEDLFSAVDITGGSCIRIENLEITSDDGADFRYGITGAGEPVEHVILRDLYIHHIDEGAVDFGDVYDLQVTDCVMSYCGFGCLMGPEGEYGGWRDVTIDGCTLSYSGHYYRGGPGPGPYDRPDGFGIEASEGPIEIKNTLCEHNRGDGLDSKSANTYIHECVVANNYADGVKLWRGGSRVENTLIYGTGDGEGGGSPWAGIVADSEVAGDRFEFVNVTVQDNPERENYPLYIQYDCSQPIEVLMRDCIVAGGYGPVYFGDTVDLTCDHNIFRRGRDGFQVYAGGRDYTAAELESGALGEGNLSRDPGFVSPAWGGSGDYHLEGDSPAVDAGSSRDAPSIDLDGNARPAGSGYDIGAYEYGSG
ncbi:MAG: right-handed parallel beta-helix repeat-containing protein [Actinomycetota bacterium]|nr:right-handed parallel beta-helix repeat-containing protein [Actinomycetota bacterium]